MSRIYFHSKSDEAELRGSERAHMAILCSDLALGILNPESFEFKKRIAKFLPSNSYLVDSKDDNYFSSSFRAYLNHGELIIDGRKVSGFTLSMNTALAIGNDPLKLMALLHGQCEVHCWFKGKDRKWLANIIQQGLDIKMYRKDQGWNDVMDFLRSNDTEEVVCSYSVCDSFPNFDCLPKSHPLKLHSNDDEQKYETFYDMDYNEKWDQCMKGLSKNADRTFGNCITPRNLRHFYFEGGETAFDVIEKMYEGN